jgi:transglutaminase-like putative cysteine protease
MVGWRRLLSSAAPEHSVPLRIWTLVTVLISLFAVTAHDEFLPYQLTIPPLVVLGFAFSYWRRGKRNWWVKVLLAIGCLFVGYRFLRDVLADPYHTSVPLTVLLLWLQTLHAFDVPARRDLLFSVLSSVILMAVAAAFTTSPFYLVYLAFYAFAAVHTLVHNAWQAELDAVRPRAARARAERRAPSELVPLPARVAAVVHRTLVIVVLGASVVYVLTPRFEGMLLTSLPFSPQRTLLDLFAGRIVNPAYPDADNPDAAARQIWNPRGYFGFSPNVDLRLRGRLDETVVMRVRANRQFNWRALVFDTYTGTGWTTSDQRLHEIDGNIPPIGLVHRQDEFLSYRERDIRVTQTFYIDVEQPNVIFAVPLADRIYITTGKLYLDRYGAMRLPGTLKPGTIYSVVSRAFVPSAARLRAANGPAPGNIRQRYLTLPEMPERVAALARGLVAGHDTTYDKVLAINRHLWTAYRYDLSIPPQRTNGDAVDYFLFEERRGYCEQFASAMAVLLRAVGIPARLVTGYTPGTLHPVTGLLEVRNSNAHAWVEVFFPGVGWVEFEPTPGFPDTASLGGPTMRRWVFQDLAAQLGAWLNAAQARSATVRSVLEVTGRVAGVAARAALPIGLIVVAAVIVLGRRPTRQRAAVGPRGHLADAYAEMCALLARHGFRRGPSETPSEYGRRAAARAPEAAMITEVVEGVAYGGIEPDDHVIERVRSDLRSLRDRLRNHGDSR